MNTGRFAPNVRKYLLDIFDRELYNIPRQHIHKKLTDLVEQNSRLRKNQQKCFAYNGEIYQYVNHQHKYPHPMNLLHREVRPQFKEFLQYKDRINVERDLVLGYCQSLMLFTAAIDDYFLLLPEHLHPTIRKNKAVFPVAEARPAFAIQDFRLTNEKYIGFMHERMVMNLINPA